MIEDRQSTGLEEEGAKIWIFSEIIPLTEEDEDAAGWWYFVVIGIIMQMMMLRRLLDVVYEI